MGNVFDENSILLNESFDNKITAIKKAGQILLDRGCVDPEYIDAMIERDEFLMVLQVQKNLLKHQVYLLFRFQKVLILEKERKPIL